MSKVLQILCFPLAILYDAVTSFYSWLYNKNIKKSYTPNIKTIVVGNLTVGGTGKTPHVEFLINLLKKDYLLAMLSRGYGRKTKGVLFANSQSTAQSIGDEPMQIFLKFGTDITVAVAENRVRGINEIIKNNKVQLVILDDAFQHHRLKAHHYILLCDYNRPFYKDFLMPAGLLRESRKNAKKADLLIVSKCPKLSKTQMDKIKTDLSPYLRADTEVFFTEIVYENLKGIGHQESPTKDIILISSIANTKKLYEYISKKHQILHHFRYGDHADYTEKKLDKILEKYYELSKMNRVSIVCTEKDMVKLLKPEFSLLLKNIPIFYLPIQISFLERESDFKKLVLDWLKS